jgi:hypothetical protein
MKISNKLTIKLLVAALAIATMGFKLSAMDNSKVNREAREGNEGNNENDRFVMDKAGNVVVIDEAGNVKQRIRPQQPQLELESISVPDLPKNQNLQRNSVRASKPITSPEERERARQRQERLDAIERRQKAEQTAKEEGADF